MPWTGKQFAAKHNHKLSGAAASEAAAQATAMIKHGVPEGEAIATANKHAGKKASIFKGGYAEGGQVDEFANVGQGSPDRIKSDEEKSGDATRAQMREAADRMHAAAKSGDHKAFGEAQSDFNSAATSWSKTGAHNASERRNSQEDNSKSDADAIQAGADASKQENIPQSADGGLIKKTAGKPVGRDDGIIAAQKGEYVIKKSSVDKVGKKVLDHINRHGRIPPSGKNKPESLFNKKS